MADLSKTAIFEMIVFPADSDAWRLGQMMYSLLGETSKGVREAPKEKEKKQSKGRLLDKVPQGVKIVSVQNFIYSDAETSPQTGCEYLILPSPECDLRTFKHPNTISSHQFVCITLTPKKSTCTPIFIFFPPLESIF